MLSGKPASFYRRKGTGTEEVSRGYWAKNLLSERNNGYIFVAGIVS